MPLDLALRLCGIKRGLALRLRHIAPPEIR
jgi:hypothetical protein